MLTYVQVAAIILIRVSVIALKQHLSNKIKGIKSVTEATIRRDKAYLLSERKDGGVVVTSIVKHKVPSCTQSYPKQLQRLINNFCNFLTTVGARYLWQGNR